MSTVDKLDADPGFEKDFGLSRSLYLRAKSSLPGGSTRGSIFFPPHPLYATSAEGCRIRFVDGLEAIDFLNNFTTLVLGHRHPAVMSAVQRQVGAGNVFGAPTELEIRLAEHLVKRYDSIDRVIFTSSGSEAISAGIRACRALTGRNGIAKFEGGYHGSYDHAKVSAKVGPDEWGDDLEPSSVPDTGGIPASVVSEVRVMRFNSIESVHRVLSREKGRIAVLLVEPVLGVGGVIPPQPGFLRAVRELCSQEGILLFFDEVITQRLSFGGAQDLYGVEADLTAFSKAMSSGFPIGALGGKKEVMEAFAGDQASPMVYHSGTFNGNPLSAAAALSTLEAMTPEIIQHVNSLGQEIRSGLGEVIDDRSLPASVTGVGSLVNIHFSPSEPVEYRAVRASNQRALQEFHLRMLENGIFLASRGLACTSAPMGAPEVAEFIETADQTLSSMRSW